MRGAAAGALAGATASGGSEAAAAGGDCSGKLSAVRSSALDNVGLAAGDIALLVEFCCWVGTGLGDMGAEGLFPDGEGGAASDSAMSRVAAGDAGGFGKACCCCWGLGESGFGGGGAG